MAFCAAVSLCHPPLHCACVCCTSLSHVALCQALHCQSSIRSRHPEPACCEPTVEDFVALLDWCEQDLQRLKSVQRVLKLIRGWDIAAAHARSAVPEDNRPRFFSMPNGVVLKYECKLGQIDFERPTGVICASCIDLRTSPERHT